MRYIEKILKSKKKVFTYNDIWLILWIKNRETIKSFLARQVKNGILNHPYKWIYTLPDFTSYEFASKIKRNSYISFETVLKNKWVIFQDYSNTIFLASDNTWEKQTIWLHFVFKKVKNDILHNPIWIEQTWQYMIASVERALCDTIYLSPGYYFDNLEDINKEKIHEIAKIYNKRLVLEIKKLFPDA